MSGSASLNSLNIHSADILMIRALTLCPGSKV